MEENTVMNVKVSLELRDRLMAEAQRNERTMSGQVRFFLAEAVTRCNKENDGSTKGEAA